MRTVLHSSKHKLAWNLLLNEEDETERKRERDVSVFVLLKVRNDKRQNFVPKIP